MSVAVSEILKQVELLSVDEQTELTARLIERARQNGDTASQNGYQPGNHDDASSRDGRDVEEDDDEAEEGLDVYSLNYMPPKASYEMKARFVYGGRGQPLRYDFSDIFSDDDEDEEAAE